ncbi:MAG: DNA mismatch repair protein MutS [Thermoplasmata archaeon]
MTELTPMMEQYYRLKKEYPDSVLFFRMGDFYEMFEEDAKTAAHEMDIVLTTRDKGKEDPVPMAGVPFHSVDTYLQKMIKKGYTVAIAEQVEDPKEATGIVKREVVRVVTPGTLIDEGLLEGAGNNFLMSVCGEDRFGVAFADISTGDFIVTEVDALEDLLSEVARNEPRECILPPNIESSIGARLKQERDMMVHIHRPESFRLTNAKSTLRDHFGSGTLESLGMEAKELAVKASGAALDYIYDTQKRGIEYITRLRFYSVGGRMILDSTTLRNLEIFRNVREGGKEGTLLKVLDETVTSMGSRKLKAWLQYPLLDADAIVSRHEAVEELYQSMFLRDDLRETMGKMADLERLISRVVYGNANARDLLQIRKTLEVIPELRCMLENIGNALLQDVLERLDSMDGITAELEKAVVDDPPTSLREGGIIRRGYNDTLDELHDLTKEGKDWINELERQERKRTGINNLKVGYNKVHGYYIEVSKTQSAKAPDDYSRKQTLKNSERYYTSELKKKEEKIISAEEKIEALEYELFVDLREKVGAEVKRFQKTAGAVAELDVLSTLATVAKHKDYRRPDISTDKRIEIKEGRHPVVETSVEDFVPNDIFLDDNKNNFVIITGPNMSGKSTYMRQVAHIVLLAHIGSFVPAESAKIGLVDRIFTRVGSFDALTRGQSTFMVEMLELASILHNASSDSLILLDEIGSGTSTFDGLSIAWSVTEYVSTKIKAKTMFATHYHELTELEHSIDRVKNLHVATKEHQGKVTFLRKVREGHTDESYGIHVAALAGVPDPVVERADAVLQQIEEDHTIQMRKEGDPRFTQVVFDVGGRPQRNSHPVLEDLKEMDIDNMTPLDALNYLWKLKKSLEES